MEKKTQYATYNGLNRTAMFMGIPLMLALLLGFIAVFGTFIGVMIFGKSGFFITGIILLIAFFFKMICEKDPNAITVMRMNKKGKLIYLRQNGIVLGESIVGFDSTGLNNVRGNG